MGTRPAAVHVGAPSATVTDLYPGDDVGFTVRAETKRNQPSGSSDYVYVSLAPEGPGSPNGYAADADTVKLWWGSGRGCYTYELAVAQPDGTYSTVTQLPNYVVDQSWQGHQDPAHHGVVRRAVRQLLGPGLDLVHRRPC